MKMFNMFAGGLDTGVAILLTVLVVLLSGGLICFLIFRTKKERERFAESRLKGTTLDRAQFDELVRRKFASATKNTHFCVFLVELNGIDNFLNSFGRLQFENAVRTLMARIEKYLPQGTKMCHASDSVVVAYAEAQLSATDVSNICALLLPQCNKPITLVAGLTVELDVNIGVAVYDEFSSTLELFRQNLELALVDAKRNGVNQFSMHTPELSNMESEEYKFYREIKSAIENKEFVLYYQPVVEFKHNRVFGYEALIRWNHTTMGVLAPSMFLNVMEQSGDINWVGIWVFEQIVRQKQEWQKANPESALTVSMNLSPKQLMNARLVEDFRQVMRKYKVKPSEICMEIVEFALFDKMSIVRENVTKLKQAGFKIAIDNYGLEMNTLSMLESLDIDMLKLDKDFVSDSRENFIKGELINMLIGYSQRNNVLLVAEGIENKEILDFVKHIGINLGQGYFFGKPKPIEEIEI